MFNVYLMHFARVILTIALVVATGLFLFTAGSVSMVIESSDLLARLFMLIAIWGFVLMLWNVDIKTAYDPAQSAADSEALCGPITPTKK